MKRVGTRSGAVELDGELLVPAAGLRFAGEKHVHRGLAGGVARRGWRDLRTPDVGVKSPGDEFPRRRLEVHRHDMARLGADRGVRLHGQAAERDRHPVITLGHRGREEERRVHAGPGAQIEAVPFFRGVGLFGRYAGEAVRGRAGTEIEPEDDRHGRRRGQRFVFAALGVEGGGEGEHREDAAKNRFHGISVLY
jgi:hypothetical protein